MAGADGNRRDTSPRVARPCASGGGITGENGFDEKAGRSGARFSVAKAFRITPNRPDKARGYVRFKEIETAYIDEGGDGEASWPLCLLSYVYTARYMVQTVVSILNRYRDIGRNIGI